MELIKPPDSFSLSRVRFYFCLLVFLVQTCHNVLGQSCQSQSTVQRSSEEIKLDEVNVPRTPSCGQTEPASEDSNNVMSSFEGLPFKKLEFETGLEFIRDSYQLKLDYDLYFGEDRKSIQRRNSFTPIELVQLFIDDIKRIPEPKEEYEGPIASGTDMNRKPAWCFLPYYLSDLVEVELSIYNILKQSYLQNKKLSFPALESYLKDIEESSLRAIYNLEQLEASKTESSTSHEYENPSLYIASHPILIYRLVRRFAEDLQPILSELEPYNEELIGLLYEEANPKLLVFPTSADLNDALDAINRMQHGNNLSTYELGRGILANVDTGIHLSALHSLEVGAFYLEKRDFDYAIEWMHFAIETVKKSPFAKLHPEIEGFFGRLLALAVNEHNANFEQYFVNNWDPGVFNTTVTLPFEPTSYVRRINALRTLASEERNKPYWNWALKANFKTLCSGQNLQTEEEIAKLTCWYDKANNNPYWLIHPLKTELLNMDPPVYQIYEFIGEKMIAAIKRAAVSQLQRSTVVDTTDATKSKVDSTRTSTQTWLYDDRKDGEFLKPLAKRFELLSGLVILPPSSSDAFQVATYGPSHHYEAHLDAFEDPRRAVEKGNRITTIMGYLNDVTVGGRTAFPIAGAFAEPIKGSVVMWDNLKRNGEQRDERTWHGGCPVVLGIKWITNKWVYYKDNIFTFQCTLNENE